MAIPRLPAGSRRGDLAGSRAVAETTRRRGLPAHPRSHRARIARRFRSPVLRRRTSGETQPAAFRQHPRRLDAARGLPGGTNGRRWKNRARPDARLIRAAKSKWWVRRRVRTAEVPGTWSAADPGCMDFRRRGRRRSTRRRALPHALCDAQALERGRPRPREFWPARAPPLRYNRHRRRECVTHSRPAFQNFSGTFQRGRCYGCGVAHDTTPGYASRAPRSPRERRHRPGFSGARGPRPRPRPPALVCDSVNGGETQQHYVS